MYSKVSICLCNVYFSLIMIGVYLKAIAFLPTLSDKNLKSSITWSMEGTLGSMSLSKPVIDIYQNWPNGFNSSKYLNIGLGFLVQNPITSTTSGFNKNLVTKLG